MCHGVSALQEVWQSPGTKTQLSPYSLLCEQRHSLWRGDLHCTRIIWLTEEEELQYNYGQRNFQISNHARHVDVA